MKQFFKVVAVALMASFAIASCGKEQKPADEKDPVIGGNEPAEEVDAYFSPENPSMVIMNGSTTFDIVVCRNDSEKEVTLGVKVLKKSDGLTVPQSLTFPSGKSRTVISVGLPSDCEVGAVLTLELELEGVNAFQSGVNTTYSVNFSNPLHTVARSRIIRNVGGNFEWESQYGQWGQEIMVISDDYYIVKNFLNEPGLDLELRTTYLDEANGVRHLTVSKVTEGYGEAFYDDDYNDYTFYFGDYVMNAAGEEEYQSRLFYPFGQSSWFNFSCSLLYYGETVGSDYETYIYDGSGYLYINCCDNYYSDAPEKAKYYDYIQIAWDPSMDAWETIAPEEPPIGDFPLVRIVMQADEDPSISAEFSGHMEYNEGNTVVVIEDMLYYDSEVRFTFASDGSLTNVYNTYCFDNVADYGCYSITDYMYSAEHYFSMDVYVDGSGFDSATGVLTLVAYLYDDMDPSADGTYTLRFTIRG